MVFYFKYNKIGSASSQKEGYEPFYRTLKLPLKKISGGKTSMTVSELPRVLTVVLLRMELGGNFC